MIQLSIVIPTFNRAKQLERLLNSICEQINELNQKSIDICILDNCSDDETPRVVKKYMNNVNCLSYKRNYQNIGSDKNFIKAFNEGKGPFLWILADDELLLAGSLNRVLEICKYDDFGCIYLSSIAASAENIVGFIGNEVQNKFDIFKFYKIDFVKFLNYRLTFISGCIINRKNLDLMCVNKDTIKFMSSNLVHLVWVYSAIKSKTFSLYIKSPIIVSTVGERLNYDPVKVFMENQSNIFFFFFGDVIKNAKKLILFETLIGWFPSVTYNFKYRDLSNRIICKIEPNDFPESIKNNVFWAIYKVGLLEGRRPYSFLSLIILKFVSLSLRLRMSLKGVRIIIS